MKSDSISEMLNDFRIRGISNHNIGTVYLEMGNYDLAKEYLYKSKSFREAQVGIDSCNLTSKYELSSTLNNIARVYEESKDIQKAIEFYNIAIDIQNKYNEEGGDIFSDKLSNTFNNLASLYYTIGDLGNAGLFYSKAIAILSKEAETNPYRVALTYANTLGNYAALLCECGSVAESELYFDKAIETCDLLKDTAPYVVLRPKAMIKVNQASYFIRSGRFDVAEGLLSDALLLFEELTLIDQKSYSEEISMICSNSAIAFIELGNLEKAESMYLKAYDKCKQMVSDMSMMISKGRTIFNIGNFYSVYKGDQVISRRYFKEAEDLFSQIIVNVPQLTPFLSMVHNGTAYSYLYSRDFDNALRYVDKAISLTPEDINLYDSKCEILAKSGNRSAAVETLNSILNINPNVNLKELPSYSLIYGKE